MAEWLVIAIELANRTLAHVTFPNTGPGDPLVALLVSFPSAARAGQPPGKQPAGRQVAQGLLIDEYGYCVRVRQALVACGLIVAFSMVGSAATASELPPRVTVIADSVFGEVVGNRDSRTTVSAGFEMKIYVGICRRLTGTSCLYQGVEPPTLIDVVHSLGSGIAPTVIVEAGYNDLVETFPQAVEDATEALLAAGVRQILWVTMAERRSQYVPMNEMLRTVAGRHPEVRFIDWAKTSRSHESWFLGDGVHLTYEGAQGMARLVHASLVDALVSPLVVPKLRLPIAHPGMRYRAQLTARGGVAPYRWRVTSGELAAGLHLLPGGEITGSPHRAARMPLGLRVTDAAGQMTSVKTTITIAAAFPELPSRRSSFTPTDRG